MRKDFKIFKVKVLMIFSGTQGFPARKDGRYFNSIVVKLDQFAKLI